MVASQTNILPYQFVFGSTDAGLDKKRTDPRNKNQSLGLLIDHKSYQLIEGGSFEHLKTICGYSFHSLVIYLSPHAIELEYPQAQKSS